MNRPTLVAWLLLLAASCTVATLGTHAQETAPTPPRPYHHVTGFVGYWLEELTRNENSASEKTEWVASPTFGLGYEYRTSQNKGLVFFYERAGGEAATDVVGGGVGVHSDTGWWVLVASIWERREDDNTWKLRFGLNKEFRVGAKKRTTITPTLNFDMAETNFVTVFGLRFGRMF